MDQAIFIAEGEKAVDALVKLGVPATCSPGGAEKWRNEYSQPLAGANVVILPDNDEAGERHCEAVARSLAGIAASVRVLRLPGLPTKGDAYDWVEAGGTAEQLSELVERDAPHQEAQRLLDAASMPHSKLFIRLALATAGRASALLELTWDRVDLDARRIDLRDPNRPRTRKGRARVPINDSLFDALMEAKESATSPYVIEWGGERVLSVKKGVSAAARRAGVKCSPHVLRHTAAVWMAEDGVPMQQIAQYLGHDDSRTTERVYARFSPDYLRDAAKALNL